MIIQIEHIDAVRNLDDILEVDGINSICIAPMDLSGSLGILGQMDNPEYIKTCDVIIEKVRKTDKILGIATGYLRQLMGVMPGWESWMHPTQ